MPKCPKCNAEIEILNNYVSGENRFDFWVEDGESQTQHEDWIADDKINNFECPDCHKVLFTDGDDAISFLEGKDELKRIVKDKINKIEEDKNAQNN